MKTIIILLTVLIVGCTSLGKQVVTIEKERISQVEKGKKIALHIPDTPMVSSDMIRPVVTSIASALFPQSIRLSLSRELHQADTPIVIVKAAQSTRSDYVIYIMVEYSSFTAIPKENLYPDHVDQEKRAQTYRQMLAVTTTFTLYDGKTAREILRRDYRNEYATTPFITFKSNEEWEKQMISYAVRESSKEFFQSISGEKFKTQRVMFSQ